MCSGHFNHFQKQLGPAVPRLYFQFPCYCLHFLAFPDIADVIFRGQRPKGNQALLLFLCPLLPWFTCAGPSVPPAHVEQRPKEPLTHQDESAKVGEQTAESALTSHFQGATSALVMALRQRPPPADPNLLNEAALCVPQWGRPSKRLVPI